LIFLNRESNNISTNLVGSVRKSMGEMRTLEQKKARPRQMAITIISKSNRRCGENYGSQICKDKGGAVKEARDYK